MTRAVQPTAAQLLALKMASVEPIQYYRGGFYATPTEWRKREQPERILVEGEMVSTSPQTLRACVARGWLAESDDGDAWEKPIIYSTRWEITDAGRALAKEQGE